MTNEDLVRARQQAERHLALILLLAVVTAVGAFVGPVTEHIWGPWFAWVWVRPA